MDPTQDQVNKLVEALSLVIKALQKIRDEDYRGNRCPDHFTAKSALSEIEKLGEEK